MKKNTFKNLIKKWLLLYVIMYVIGVVLGIIYIYGTPGDRKARANNLFDKIKTFYKKVYEKIKGIIRRILK